ncbi:biopolymer transporter ExbD [Parvibaculum sedimenti]|uniref:Biopolymer transporter ExbD n=1 Tax=Parvibaculum sedimenti TaxID=2608632 RepID=A0A6N6VMA1_9HYPH|nr:biopolymer transporter ExbD [Parvibaculum sedimenti]KAB7742719.1 biopolymer transporter ExbD [Parvibaculum sedimenti]
MAMNIGGGSDDDVMMEINTTPLIDVMLVLLVMLIITIPLQTQAVKLDMPQNLNAPPPVVEPQVVDLEVDFDGTVFWNGIAVPNTGQLDEYLKAAAAQDPQPEIHLKPNRLVKYDYVAKVLAAAQRLGVDHIGFVGNEQYMD